MLNILTILLLLIAHVVEPAAVTGVWASTSELASVAAERTGSEPAAPAPASYLSVPQVIHAFCDMSLCNKPVALHTLQKG